MILKGSKLKELQDIYDNAGNSICLVYGQMGSEKEALMKDFVRDKKVFYYRARSSSMELQREMMAKEISARFDVRLMTGDYKEMFNRVKSGDASKLVLIFDEFQLIAKRDPEFLNHIAMLKAKKYYPGPVMILLLSSSLVWVEQELSKILKDKQKLIDYKLKIEPLNFLEVVRAFPNYPVSESIKLYGIMGGVPEYMNHWNANRSFQDNICDLVLRQDGFLFHRAEEIISSELRELSVYSTILATIASGQDKLNELYLATGYSRAKISVYMKNLSQFDIVEKVSNFETGGWEQAKKGVYQIKDTFVDFWFRFVYPHMSDLYWMEPQTFYKCYIEKELPAYLNKSFRKVCMEYLTLLEQVNRLPIHIHKMGTWIGKEGNIDIIAQDTNRETVIALCNFEKDVISLEMVNHLMEMAKQAKIASNHIYLFSANAFSQEVKALAEKDSRFELIDMNEL